MRTVLIIGDQVPGGLAGAIASGFRSQSWTVRCVDFGAVSLRVLRSVAHRWPTTSRPMRRRLHATVEREDRVDLALVVKGPFLSPDDVVRIGRTLRAPVVCWNPDDPTDPTLSNSGAGIPKAMSAYDAYVTWSPIVAQRLAGLTRRVLSVPFGWDASTHFPSECVAPTPGVVFVGTRSPEREVWMRSIADLGPTVYGNGWAPISGVSIGPPVSGTRFREVTSGARAVLNFLRPQNAGTHNMRTFEIPGCGGLQVAEHSHEHERMLRDCRLFRNPIELRAILTEETLAPLGTTPSWVHDHSYTTRVGELLAQL